MPRNRFLLGLALITAAFLAVAASRYSSDWFGKPHDDALYFSSAKAIAEGHGYVMPSLPGEPPQTKYPPLYSALLSLVWKVQPAFPENLAWAWRLNLLLAAASLWASAALARQLGASRLETLGLAAVMAIHPYFVYWSNHLVSEMLFSALALTGVVLAQRRMEAAGADGPWSWGPWLGACALLGLACMTRTVGVVFVAGVAGAALLRKLWLPGLVALVGAAPVAVGLLRHAAAPPPVAADVLEGFRQNVIYYSSYVGHWIESVSTTDILLAQTSFVFKEVLKHPAVSVFQIPAAGFPSFPVAVLAIAISAGIVVGIVSRARANGLHPIHLAALFYLPIILLWNFMIMDRFWAPFLIVFLAGASGELIRIVTMTRASWRTSGAGDRVVIGAFGSAIALLVAFAAYHTLYKTPRGLSAIEGSRAALAAPKLEAYRWLADNSAETDVVISYDDPVLYLYTGRHSIRAFSPLTDSFFAQSRELMDRDLDQMTDTAAELGARFWLVSPDDFGMTHAPDEIRERMDAELASAPVVFASSDGQVKIHDISRMPWAAPSLETRVGHQPQALR